MKLKMSTTIGDRKSIDSPVAVLSELLHYCYWTVVVVSLYNYK